MITWIDFANHNSFHQYFFEAPIDEGHTRIFFVNMRTFLLEPENDQRLVNVNLIVAKEDIDILEALDPVRTPESPTEEVLVPSDGAVVRYRDFLKQWTGKGWRIDLKKLRAEQGDRAFAIPCPARRTSKNWVLKPVPLLPPQ
jgi:phenylpropionate dioxygenase-like ring-hydroxylating dioxygenase large terminal subunit